MNPVAAKIKAELIFGQRFWKALIKVYVDRKYCLKSYNVPPLGEWIIQNEFDEFNKTVLRGNVG